MCELAVDDVEIGPADATRADREQHLAVSGLGLGELRALAAAVSGASSTIARIPAVCRPAVPRLATQSTSLSYRRLDVDELARVGEIDRDGAHRHALRAGGCFASRGSRRLQCAPWDPVGTGEHSVAAQRAELARYVEKGAICIGAFDDCLIGIGVVLPHLRPDVAQLAYLHVTDGRRGQGVGATLTDELERLAREAGNRTMVVSATPSRQYRRLLSPSRIRADGGGTAGALRARA